MDIPGYRFDERTNRYFREDPGALRDLGGKSRDQDVMTSATRLTDHTRKKAVRTYDANWLLNRACGKVKMEVITSSSLGSPVNKLTVSPNGKLIAAANQGNALMCIGSVSSQWNRINMSPDSFPEDFGTDMHLVAAIERSGDAILFWHPNEPALVFASGTERNGYMRLNRIEGEEYYLSEPIKLAFEPYCGAWQPGENSVIILGPAKARGAVIDLNENRTRHLIPKIKSDALSCTFINENTLLIGLRQGRMMIWDCRQRNLNNASSSSSSIGAPIMQLAKSQSNEELLFVHAPAGLSSDSSWLYDIRFLEKSVARFDLRCRLSTCLTAVGRSHPDIGSIVAAVDARDGCCKVFEMDTARYLTDISCTLPSNTTSIALVGSVETSLLLLGSTMSGDLFKCVTTVNTDDD